MMTKTNLKKLSFGFLALALFTCPKISFGDWSIGIGVGDHHDDRWDHRDDHGFYRWHEHPHWGLHIHILPPGYFTIWVGGERYYYYDGLYYTYVGYGDYVLVNPPLGAYVTAIPPDFQPVLINGRTYYTDNGVYYVLTRYHGYKVVAPPLVYSQPVQVIESQPVTTVVAAPTPPPAALPMPADPDTFPLNIPNNSGGYTTVVIKRSGNGYVGPQGEYYASFPSVSQLKAMYVK